MSDSSNESSNPFAFLEPKLTAWKLVGKTANDNAKSSPSRERFLLKAIRIAHNVGHYNQLSAEIISNVRLNTLKLSRIFLKQRQMDL